MASKFIREVVCDCCNKQVEDMLTGYIVRRVGGYVYDLCNRCAQVVALDLSTLENEYAMTNLHGGREPEDGEI